MVTKKVVKVAKKSTKKSVKKKVKKTTKKVVNKLDDDLGSLTKKMQGCDDHTLSVVEEVYNALQNVRTEFVFSEIFHKISCPTFHIEGMIDKFWRDYTIRYGIPALELIYAKLKDLDRIDYNDLDNEMWIIPDPKGKDRRILIHTSQNLRLLFVWDKNLSEDPYGFGEIHVRRFYDRYKDEDNILEELNKVENKIQWAIRHTNTLLNYADDLDNNYPDRYSLEHYLKNEFTMQYGDARDKGCIISVKGFFASNSGTLSQHNLLKIVWDCCIPCMLSELYSCSAYDSLSNQFNSKGGLISSYQHEEEDLEW